MGKEIFGPANRLGQGIVRSLLPEGRKEGSEWVALNPRRSDQHIGSLKVNLNTGEWCDFAMPDEAKGRDFVSLYAYIYEEKLRHKAEEHKNYRAGLQFEAAQDLLITYDKNYFPDKTDFVKKEKNGSNFWDGWYQITAGIQDPPKLDLSWYEDKWGAADDQWEFIINNKIVMYVCRFMDKDKKKQDRPFTLWSDGNNYKWRSKAPDGKYPLWGVDKLSEEPNLPVLLMEGQKCSAVLSEILTKFVCIGWYGGSNALSKQDWQPLEGREVYYSFDADPIGRKTINKITDIMTGLNVKLHIVHPPEGVKKGWDLADTITDGWTEKKLIKHIKQEPAEKKKKESFVDDENPYEFEILGHTKNGNDVVFYPHGSRQIITYKTNALTKGVLMTLQDRGVYGKFFGKDDGGIAWDAVINHIIRIADKRPIFSHSKTRGAGAWRDNGHLVINTGEYLLVDGERKELYESPGQYIYERNNFIPYCKEEKMSVQESSRLKKICKMINWKFDLYGDLLTGWLTLAPFGGALEWRPYIWITGPVGGGKSWILTNIANRVAGNYGIFARGTSTSAGIRNKLANNSLATIIDEMEADNPKAAENIENNLRMFREGSSGSEGGAVTLHGTPDGEGREWIVQSMALFASVGAGIKHGADRSRFTELTLQKFCNGEIKDRESNFEILEQETIALTSTWSNAYHTRTHNLFSELEKCIKVMTKQMTDYFGNRRQGDQLGTLLAGSWMSDHDQSATAAEAYEYIKSLNFEPIIGDTDVKTDEELILDEILASHIEITDDGYNKRYTVGAILSYWFSSSLTMMPSEVVGISADLSKLKKELEQHGIKPKSGEKNTIQIAVGHPAIRRMLRETPWASVYDSLLGRLDCCDGKLKGPGRFAGIAKRYRELDAKEVLDAVPF